VKSENEKIRQKNQVLEQKLQNINPEQMVRDELLMQKDGEYVVKVPPLPSDKVEKTVEKNEPNWKKWLKLIL
jgi:cell division protein FtsB